MEQFIKECNNMNFNFHHRVVETSSCRRWSELENSFNFHHRVVETFLYDLSCFPQLHFNFHHRVVETHPVQILSKRCAALTFTIGWLKLLFIISTNSTRSPLTFTIGWLKRKEVSIFVQNFNFNFHHRVVETA